MPDTQVDHYFPRLGRCQMCGSGDQRHRVLDSIHEQYHAGDSALSIAVDYGVPIEVVAAVAAMSEAERATIAEPATPTTEPGA